jgi:hypothetical protein
MASERQRSISTQVVAQIGHYFPSGHFAALASRQPDLRRKVRGQVSGLPRLWSVDAARSTGLAVG